MNELGTEDLKDIGTERPKVKEPTLFFGLRIARVPSHLDVELFPGPLP